MLEIPFALFLPWAFILGICLGSFYGVCISRYLEDISIGGRSFCPACHNTLKPWHLVPIVSYLFLKGKCAFCKTHIPVNTLIIELVSGLLAMLLAWHYGPSWAFLAAFAIVGVLTIASGIDLQSFILPDILTIPLALVAFPLSVWVFGMDWLDSLLGAVLAVGMLLAVMWFFKRLRGLDGLGLGDVKLMIGLGFLSGVNGLSLLLLTACFSALLLAFIWTRDKGKYAQIPFGPFLSVGGLVAMLWTPEWVDMQMRLINWFM